jgi:hypothetical protein
MNEIFDALLIFMPTLLFIAIVAAWIYVRGDLNVE